MNKRLLFAIPVTGGVLTALAWTTWFSGLVLLVSLVPFIYVWHYLYENKESYHPNAVFIYLAPGFLVFNILTLWWVHVASIVAVLFLVVTSTFIMTFAFWLAHIVRLKTRTLTGIIALISFWLSLEYINLNIDPFNPWLNLGSGLAKDVRFIQWYDTTGTAGGTLWILLTNILIAQLIILADKRLFVKYIYSLALALIVIIPTTISLVKYKRNTVRQSDETEIVIIQPNIDPYSEKFTIPFDEQLEMVLNMAEEAVTENTRWVITPETTIDDPINELDYLNNKYISAVHIFLKKHPKVTLVMGSTTRIDYGKNSSGVRSSSKKEEGLDPFYDVFNSAVKIDTGKQVSYYHKSKLVPGFEKQLAGAGGKIAKALLPYLGGTQSGYGSQPERDIFSHSENKQSVAPVVCYESVFGEYVTEYVKKGAGFLFIITNDGWWKNTNGYRQHLSFASLRAIESRRSIARAANTGISCFIDKRGVITSSTEWWSRATLTGNITYEDYITPYVKYGDYILRLGNIGSIIILLVLIYFKTQVRSQKSEVRGDPMVFSEEKSPLGRAWVG